MAPIDSTKVYDSELMRRLRNKHADLRPALKKVSTFLQANPYRSATLNIEELAGATGTSTAAVNRLANAIELNGFTGLRFALMENLLAVVSSADVISDRLKQSPEAGFKLEQQISLSKQHLDNVSRMNDNQTFEQMARQLAGSQNVFVVGFGNSFHLAAMAAAGLSPFCAGAHCVTLDGGLEGSAYRLSGITGNDTLLAIALPAYTRDTIRLAEYAKSRSACVLSITDCPASPLVDASSLSLFIPPHHPVLPNSKVGLMAAIEALLAQVQLCRPLAVGNQPSLPDWGPDRDGLRSSLPGMPPSAGPRKNDDAF
jgi:DNA-binding MurR/RpiR family transcriptional regulator